MSESKTYRDTVRVLGQNGYDRLSWGWSEDVDQLLREHYTAEVEKLLAGVSGQLQTLVSEIGESDYAMALIRVGDIKAERDRLRAALEQYADRANWSGQATFRLPPQQPIGKQWVGDNRHACQLAEAALGEGGARTTKDEDAEGKQA